VSALEELEAKLRQLERGQVRVAFHRSMADLHARLSAEHAEKSREHEEKARKLLEEARSKKGE
jgi:hypothetical protein